jgi:hypothetical protein
MNPGIAVEFIVGIFFLIGVAVGVVAVIALSAIRKDKNRPPGGPAAIAQDGEPDEPPDLALDDDDRPRWPGTAGGGFGSR